MIKLELIEVDGEKKVKAVLGNEIVVYDETKFRIEVSEEGGYVFPASQLGDD
jgi:hypothetical protein